MSSHVPRRLRSLLGFAILAALFVGVWFVLAQLRASVRLQDCYASGRRDCVTIDRDGAHANR